MRLRYGAEPAFWSLTLPLFRKFVRRAHRVPAGMAERSNLHNMNGPRYFVMDRNAILNPGRIANFPYPLME